MNRDVSGLISSRYRVYYGKLYSGLLHYVGPEHADKIDDAIQNAFYKALRSWKPNRIPNKPDHWLFTVAKNDLLDTLRGNNHFTSNALPELPDTEPDQNTDLRLNTILWICGFDKLNEKSRILFILKTIFGLHVKEISSVTFLSIDAIYKNLQRTTAALRKYSVPSLTGAVTGIASESQVSLAEQVLYAVFNLGFDSLNERSDQIINEDLCLEALALGKQLYMQSGQITTKHLLSLFCFQLARIPAKLRADTFIPFFEQDKTVWDPDLLQLGFRYLEKPAELNRYYLESLITSKHMTTNSYDESHWKDILSLYDLLLQYANSPVVLLNICYCLSRVDKTDEARALLDQIKDAFPDDYVFHSLTKAMLLEKDSTSRKELLDQSLEQVTQEIRRSYIKDILMN